MNVLLDRLRRNAVRFIELMLEFTAPGGFVDGVTHGFRDLVGVEDDFGVDVSRTSSDRLHERGFAAQEPLFIRIQNGDQRDFRKIKTFTQEVHADEDVKFSFPQFPQEFHALKGIQFAVEPLAPYVFLQEIVGKIFRKPFRQCRDQYTLAFCRTLADLLQKVRHLSRRGDRGDGRSSGIARRRGNYFDDRIQKSRRPNDLFHVPSLSLRQLVRSRRRGDVDDLIDPFLPFIKRQRSIIHRAWKAESVFHERLFAVSVCRLHPADLRDRHVRFVHEKKVVVREKAEERIRRTSRFASGKRLTVVLDSRTVADLLKHFHIVARACRKTLCLQKFPLILEVFKLRRKFTPDLHQCVFDLFFRKDEMFGRIDT